MNIIQTLRKLFPTYEKCETCEFSRICHKKDPHNCILYEPKQENLIKKLKKEG